ncbi:MAG: hypothetical protein WBE80_10060 [Methylocella sp.]
MPVRIKIARVNGFVRKLRYPLARHAAASKLFRGNGLHPVRPGRRETSPAVEDFACHILCMHAKPPRNQSFGFMALGPPFVARRFGTVTFTAA